MSNNLEDWEAVNYRMREEGIDYCFEHYSNWDEIQDDEFHRLRLGFLQYMKEIREYVNKKIEEEEFKDWGDNIIFRQSCE